MAHGEYTHIEIPFDDEDRMKAFYEAVFGWKFTSIEGFDGYSMLAPGPGALTGGAGRRGVMAPASIRNYVDVNDLEAALVTVVAGGGSVVQGKQDMGRGWYAVIHDSEGNELGLYQPRERG